ncbi:hypothetical protein [uncultured Photobacterium sp.]|uniref:hypothetical protein n=1 Tax=uncultured Photobacterium sp. TaxID=173973 RepID=UPI0026300974|nr:hypothetical protein [uncultured Photobacterium sp.]
MKSLNHMALNSVRLAPGMLLEAIDLGAVTARRYVVDGQTLFSWHFFNAEGLEIAYYIVDMLPLVGLTKVERKWSESFLCHPDYQEYRLESFSC